MPTRTPWTGVGTAMGTPFTGSGNLDVTTLVRRASIQNIVGVKEASGNMTQMCEICGAVPSDFIVLSGDDALTLPLMAIGGRGIVSVASNEIPAEMVQL